MKLELVARREALAGYREIYPLPTPVFLDSLWWDTPSHTTTVGFHIRWLCWVVGVNFLIQVK